MREATQKTDKKRQKKIKLTSASKQWWLQVIAIEGQRVARA